MCGITGLWGKEAAHKEILEMLLERLVYRGPDGMNVYYDEDIAFGHTRLCIVDIECGGQPFCNEDQTIFSVVNGEIYNYGILREQLIKQGHILNTQCDSELIPHLYEEYGEEMFSKLIGQYAIVIWDKRKKQLLMSRDRFGEKPLFYTKYNGTIIFSSDIQCLVKIVDDKQLNIKCLKDICTTWGPLGEHTFIEGIKSVQVGTYIIFEDYNIKKQVFYYKPEFKYTKYESNTIQDYIKQLEALLINSIKSMIPSEVPFAFCLSGGLDSALIVGMAQHYLQGPLNTFSLGFTDQTYDESMYQDIMVNKWGLNHKKIVISSQDIIENLNTIIQFIGQPIVRAGSLPMYMLFNRVRESGFKVILSGEGADELFGGYDIFKESLIREFCEKDKQSKNRRMLYGKINNFSNNYKLNNVYALSTYYEQIKSEQCFSSHQLRFKMGEFCYQFLSEDAKEKWRQYSINQKILEDVPDKYSDFTTLSKAQYLEIKTLLQGYLLSSQGDRVSMGNSVECRYPFLDLSVAQFALQLPDQLKMKGLNEKYLLKQLAYKYVPVEIIKRKKFPYRAPIDFKQLLRVENIREAITYNELVKTKIFNANAVDKFMTKISNKDIISEKETIALLFIISTQLLMSRGICEV